MERNWSLYKGAIMEIKFNLNIKLILTILLIVGLIVSNVLMWRATTQNKKSVIGIVNYLNNQQARQQPQIPQQPQPQPKEEKK